MPIRALLGTSLVAFALMTGSAWGLTQLPGTAGCVAVSPDGRNLYVTSLEPGGISVFSR